jgi:ubiquinone/menaquinone biosynthesis C-methylase UbiE
MSSKELIDFIDPKPSEVIFDAGCGTGANIVLLHAKVRHIIGMDVTEAAISRCRQKILTNKIYNAFLLQGDVTQLPLPSASVDKILCLSVFQYLTDFELRETLREYQRILRDNGAVILHVKNLSSLNLSTLWLAKRLKSLLRRTKQEHLRSYRWYMQELQSLGFEIEAYNSFNFFLIESMPRSVIHFLQKLELTNRDRLPFRAGFMRRHGSELKIKARIRRTR